MILWIEEIPHQLVDGSSRYNSIYWHWIDSYQYLPTGSGLLPSTVFSLCGWTICRTVAPVGFQISTFELEQLRRTKQSLDAVQSQAMELGKGKLQFPMEDRGEYHLQNVVSVVFWSFLVLSCKIWPRQMYPNVKWHGAAINALGIREKQGAGHLRGPPLLSLFKHFTGGTTKRWKTKL